LLRSAARAATWRGSSIPARSPYELERVSEADVRELGGP
jgi:hypothetical protein